MSDELTTLIQARYPLIATLTADEPTDAAHIAQAARELGRNLYDWSLSTGTRIYAPDTPNPSEVSGTDKPEKALRQLLRQKRPMLGCFRGLAGFSTQPLIQRLLRDFCDQCDPAVQSVVLLDEEMLHPRVRRLTVPWRPPMPDPAELDQIVRERLRTLRKTGKERIATDLKKSEYEQLVLNLRGLNRTEAQRVIQSVILDDHMLCRADLSRVIDSKRRLLEGAGSLESVTIDFDIDEVGGLRTMKDWLADRRGGFSQSAREYGLQPPRGVLMLGVPGCGKSLCAKAVAADWKMPLLRLDPGVLYQKYVGESENQLRRAIEQAEAMAPVILWIDEIEKAFASASAGSADGGLSQRMFGTLLSWMQDHREPIFIIATANDISALPPELMRKGRFDEIFFIDLPGVDARRQIFAIHLKRRNRDPDRFHLDELVDASKDFTGSEIEQAIVSGMFRSFTADRELNTADIVAALQETRPLSVMMHERIMQLRQWADQRCVPAE